MNIPMSEFLLVHTFTLLHKVKLLLIDKMSFEWF